MITRKEYLEGNATHDEYWAQFVTDDMSETILREFGLAAIISAGPHFNGIELKLWDSLPIPSGLYEAVGATGDVNARCLGTIVCAYKAAARLILGRCYVTCGHKRCASGATCCKRVWHFTGRVCTHCGMED